MPRRITDDQHRSCLDVLRTSHLQRNIRPRFIDGVELVYHFADNNVYIYVPADDPVFQSGPGAPGFDP